MHAGQRMQGDRPCFKVDKDFIYIYDMERTGQVSYGETRNYAYSSIRPSHSLIFFLHPHERLKQRQQLLANLSTKKAIFRMLQP